MTLHTITTTALLKTLMIDQPRPRERKYLRAIKQLRKRGLWDAEIARVFRVSRVYIHRLGKRIK